MLNDEDIALKLKNLGDILSLVVSSFDKRDFITKLISVDLRVVNLKKAIHETLNLIESIDNFDGPSKSRYYSILWQRSHILWAQVFSYSHQNSQDQSIINIKDSEEFGRISSFINRKPVDNEPGPVELQILPGPIDVLSPLAAQRSPREFNRKQLSKNPERASSLAVRESVYHYEEPVPPAALQRSPKKFNRKQLSKNPERASSLAVRESVYHYEEPALAPAAARRPYRQQQQSLSICNNEQPASTVVQPSLLEKVWMALINYFVLPADDSTQKNFSQKVLWSLIKASQNSLTAITDYTEETLRKTVSNLFYYLRHPNYIGNKSGDLDHDENINLTKPQYYIKEIAVGLDKTIQNIFATKNLVIHPTDSLKGLYLAVRDFYQSENKWEQVKDTVDNKFQHVSEHPFQYLPDLIIFLATMIPTVYAGIRAASGAGTAATIVEESIVPAMRIHASAPSLLSPALASGAKLMLEGAAFGAAAVAGTETETLPSLFKSPSTSELSAKKLEMLKPEPVVMSIVPSRIDELKSNLVFLKECLGFYYDDNDKIMRESIIEEIDMTREAILQLDCASPVIRGEIEECEVTIVYLMRNLKQHGSSGDEALISQFTSELKVQQQELEKLKLLAKRYNKPDFNADKDVSNHASGNKRDVFFKQSESEIVFDGTSTKQQAQPNPPDQAISMSVSPTYAPG